MSWFKVDDGSAFNAKVLAAGNEAWGAFCRVGAWCAQQLTDGQFSRAIAVTIAPMRVWKTLVDAGLVDQLEKGEMQMHDYLQRNPSKEQVLAERDMMRRRVARFRNGTNKEIYERDGYHCRYCGTGKGPFSIDHVQPSSKGGTDDESNLVTACVSCNSRKKDHTLDDVGMTLRSVPNGHRNALQTVHETIPRPVPSRPDLSKEAAAAAESREEPRSQTKLKSVPPPPPEPPDRSPEHIAIALQIRTHALFRILDAHRIADHHCGWMLTTGKKLEWAIQGIDECAAKADGLGLSSEALQAKLVGFMRSAKGPKRDEREVKGGPAYKTFPTEPEQTFTPEQAKANVDRASGILATLKIGGGRT